MTAFIASVSGKASQAATWGGAAGPAANADTFTVNAGVLLEWDLSLLGLTTGLGASTVNGTLFFSRSAGVYGFKMNAVLTVSATGTLDASDGAGGAYPAACTASITFNGANSITFATGGSVINLICGEPTHKYAKLTQLEASGQAILHVDTNLTIAGDALWANGSLVRVDNINQAAQSEQYTISSLTSTQITLTGNLSNAKASGAYVVLVTRNVKIVGVASGTGLILNAASGQVGAEIRAVATGISNAATLGLTVNGTISTCSNGISNPVGWTINASITGCTSSAITGTPQANTVTGIISGCTQGLAAPQGTAITGILSGLTLAINGAINCSISATISGSGAALFTGNANVLRGATLTNNTRDLDNVSSGQAYNTLFGSATENLNYASASLPNWYYFESVDHDQVSGAFRAWTRGGIVDSVATPVYDATRARSYQHAPASALTPVFMQREVLVPAYGALYVRCYARKDSLMTYRPRLWVFGAGKEPLISGSPDAEAIMTDSVDTWEVLQATVANSTSAPMPYIVRTLAKNASGLAYFEPVIQVSSMFYPVGSTGGLAV